MFSTLVGNPVVHVASMMALSMGVINIGLSNFYIVLAAHNYSNHSNLEMEAEFLTKALSYLNLNISRTKDGRNKL